MVQHSLLWLVALVALLSPILIGVRSFSNGAPLEACFDLTPQHQKIEAQQDDAPYLLIASPTRQRVGQPINVVLQSRDNESLIKGFMVQARTGMTPVGYFRPTDQYSQTMNCGNGERVCVLKIY